MIIQDIAEKKHLFAQSTVENETILVPLRNSVASMDEMFTLNELGSFIWDAITASSNIETLTLEVVHHFDVDKETAQKDIQEFIQKLHNFIVTV